MVYSITLLNTSDGETHNSKLSTHRQAQASSNLKGGLSHPSRAVLLVRPLYQVFMKTKHTPTRELHKHLYGQQMLYSITRLHLWRRRLHRPRSFTGTCMSNKCFIPTCCGALPEKTPTWTKELHKHLHEQQMIYSAILWGTSGTYNGQLSKHRQAQASNSLKEGLRVCRTLLVQFCLSSHYTKFS